MFLNLLRIMLIYQYKLKIIMIYYLQALGYNKLIQITNFKINNQISNK